MKVFVLYDRSGIHSGRLLANELRSKGFGTVTMGRPTNLSKALAAGEKFDFIVNFGWFSKIEAPATVILNTPGAISVSSNKLRARKRFKERGIPAPELWESPEDIDSQSFPVIGRTTHHSKGQGFWFCKDKQEAVEAGRSQVKAGKKLILTKKGNKVWRTRTSVKQGASHYLKFIKNTREFRVHAISSRGDLNGISPDDYRVLKLSEKVPSANGTDSSIIKNHNNGWIFSFPEDRESDILDKVREVGRKALACFKLHWGAVDVMLCKDTGQVYVLEINSTPCLTDDQANTLEKYIKGIGALLGALPALKKRKNIPAAQKRAKKIGSLLQKVQI